jgi:hypothetical protein
LHVTTVGDSGLANNSANCAINCVNIKINTGDSINKTKITAKSELKVPVFDIIVPQVIVIGSTTKL